MYIIQHDKRMNVGSCKFKVDDETLTLRYVAEYKHNTKVTRFKFTIAV